MKNFLDTVMFIFSTIGTFIFIVFFGAWFNVDSIEFATSSFGFLVIMSFSFFINLVMYYFSNKYDD